MTDIKIKYGTPTTITCTITSLIQAGVRQGAVVDNSTDLFTDSLVAGKTKTGASGTLTNGFLNIYAYGSTDDGTTYSGDATGLDAAFLGKKENLKLLGVVTVTTNSTSYSFGPWSAAAAFGGSLPKKWGIVVENQSGGALSSTSGDHSFTYQGILGQAV